jgi:hypothetical protein
MKYFEVHSKINEGFDPAVGRFENIRRPGGCTECSTIPIGSGPPFLLKVRRPDVELLISHTSWGFGVISNKLFDIFGEDGLSNLRFGNLVDEKGSKIEGFQTFVGVERLILRGNTKSQHWICNLCNALIYTYAPRRSPYITPDQVLSGRSIYEIESMGMLVSEAIKDRIGSRWENMIKFYPVPVRETPRDGLPANLSLWNPPEKLVAYTPNLPQWMKTNTQL